MKINEVQKRIRHLEDSETDHRNLSNISRFVSRNTLLLSAGIGLASFARSEKRTRKTLVSAAGAIALGSAGLAVAGEVFDLTADRYGKRSERLIDRLHSRRHLKLSRS